MALTQQQRDFLESKNLFAVLATINPDGSAQQTVMWYELRGDSIMMNTTATRIKSRNLAQDKRVSVCIADGYRYITITGTAQLNNDPAVSQAGIRALAERYSDEPDPVKREADIAAQMEAYLKSERVELIVPIEHVVMWGF